MHGLDVALHLPRPTSARWAASGGFRDVYHLTDETGLLPYVLKVDKFKGTAAGCHTEASVYRRVRERAPDLLPNLATIIASGPGWLIQERADLAAHRLPPAWTLRSVCREIKSATGIHIIDIDQGNIGSRLSDNHCILIDYACAW